MSNLRSLSARRATAYHEAGHAVIAFWHGVPVHSVTIVGDPARGTAGSCHHSALTRLRGLDSDTSDRNRLRVERAVIVSLAGPEAQRRFNRRSVRHYHAYVDYQNAVDLASYFFADPDVLNAFMKFMALRTHHLFDTPGIWGCVKVLADSLLKQPTMNQREVKAAIRASIARRG